LAARELRITWQRFLREGKTCCRCQATEAAVEKAVEFLEQTLVPQGIKVVVEKLPLSAEDFARNPLASNRIWLNGRPLEDWLHLGVGQSPCNGVCGGAECRTLVIEETIFDAVPEALLVQAGLIAASRMLAKETTSSCHQNQTMAGSPSKVRSSGEVS